MSTVAASMAFCFVRLSSALLSHYVDSDWVFHSTKTIHIPATQISNFTSRSTEINEGLTNSYFVAISKNRDVTPLIYPCVRHLDIPSQTVRLQYITALCRSKQSEFTWQCFNVLGPIQVLISNHPSAPWRKYESLVSIRGQYYQMFPDVNTVIYDVARQWR